MRSANRRRFLKGAGTASAITLAGCLGGGGGDDTIPIGFIESLSGPFASAGRRRLWATEAAVDKVNEDGGINGREIELLVEDTETDPGTATTKAQNLINQEGIELLCGTFSSSVCLAVAPVATRNSIPYSAGYCATSRLTADDCEEYAFRGTRGNAETQWLGYAPWINENTEWNSASTMYADYAWGQTENEQFKRFYDGEIVSEVPVPAGTADFSQYLSNVDTSADILVFIQAGGDTINLLQDIESFGTHQEVEKLVTVGGGVGEFLDTADISGEVASSVQAVNFYPKFLTGPLDTPENQNFHEVYQEYAEEPRPTRSSVTGWEAIHLFRDIASEIDYTGPDQAQEFVDTWRGFEMELSEAYPQGDKYYRDDNQCQVNHYITNVQEDYTEEIIETISTDTTDDYEIKCGGDWI